MKISVLGCGYLGLTHAVCMASLGHEVVALDIKQEVIDQLKTGKITFFEPGLQELLDANSSRIEFTSDVSRVRGARVHFLGVGTPRSLQGKAADLSYVRNSVLSLIDHLGFSGETEIIVGKSTVPPGTAGELRAMLEGVSGVDLVWNPEFLQEGNAVNDTLRPDRIVYGTHNGEANWATELLDECYQDILDTGTPRFITDFATSELIKLAANSFLATKISFANAYAQLCDTVGADILTLVKAIGVDERIGEKFLGAGIGFGGGCLPKDLAAVQAIYADKGLEVPGALFTAVEAINQDAHHYVSSLAVSKLENSGGKKVAIAGAAFKANSDDIRESPGLRIAKHLLEQGFDVVVTDPAALGSARKALPTATFVHDIRQAVQDADLLLVVTEWQEYKNLDPADLAPKKKIVIDARNCLDVNTWKNHGWDYTGVGHR